MRHARIFSGSFLQQLIFFNSSCLLTVYGKYYHFNLSQKIHFSTLHSVLKTVPAQKDDIFFTIPLKRGFEMLFF